MTRFWFPHNILLEFCNAIIILCVQFIHYSTNIVTVEPSVNQNLRYGAGILVKKNLPFSHLHEQKIVKENLLVYTQAAQS